MSVLSFLFYVLAHHPVKLVFLMPALCLAFFLFQKSRGKQSHAGWWAIPVFVVFQLNIFTGQFLNAAFLHAVGTDGEAIIIAARPTSSTLNEQPIWAYEAVVRTADGQSVSTTFTTMSATLWPIRNRILIPPQGEPTPVRYVPGFPRNVVFLTDESASGRRRFLHEAREPVEIAERRLAASPDNAGFRRAYREALETYLADHADLDPAVTADYRARLEALPR